MVGPLLFILGLAKYAFKCESNETYSDHVTV